MTGLLWRAQWRYLRGHPWQLFLALLGIALGVAVVVAVDLANNSAQRAFDLSLQNLLGRATHVIEGPPQGIDEAVYRQLRLTHDVRPSAPVVEGYAEFRGELVRIMGIDAFAETPFRQELAGSVSGDVEQLLTRPRTILVNAADAERWQVEIGASLDFAVSGRPQQAEVLGTYRLGAQRNAALLGVWLTDIGTAQLLLDRLGRLTRIDLRLSAAEARDLAAQLPPGLHLEASATRNRALDEMTSAFRLNLTAMSLLALLVGMFLIYNITTFMALNRRVMLGTLRLSGVTRQQVFALVLGEAALLGLGGGLLGLGLGILLAQGLLQLVTQTINDLYFVLAVRDLHLAPLTLLKGLLLGIGAALLAAVVPAWEAARYPPQQALQRSQLEQRVQRLLPLLGLVGLGLAGVGAGVLLGSGRSLLLAFLALFLLLLGTSLCLPWLSRRLVQALVPLLGALFGLTGRLAGRGVSAAISRTGIAIAALALAVSATVGVGLMIDSFRQAVSTWLESTLRADFYISQPGPSERPSGPIEPAVRPAVAAVAGVATVTGARRVEVQTGRGSAELLALDMTGEPHRGMTLKSQRDGVWSALRAGEGVLISEPYAYRRAIGSGDHVTLATPQGTKRMPVLGVFRDYGSEQGYILMSRQRYRTWWQDDTVFSLGVFLEPGADAAAVRARLRDVLAAQPQALRVASNREIRTLSMAIFDRTFAITQVLRLLAILVAVVGVLSALIALQLERAREYAILRATGYTPAQVAGLAILQSAIMGLLAGLAALPLGVGMGGLLIEVINQRAFGWSMAMQVAPAILGQALLLALCAAVVASVYPAWRLVRTPPARALQDE